MPLDQQRPDRASSPSAQSESPAFAWRRTARTASSAMSPFPLRTAASISSTSVQVEMYSPGASSTTCWEAAERVFIAAERVVEDRARPTRECDTEPLSVCHRVGQGGIDECRRVFCPALVRGTEHRPVRSNVNPCRLLERLVLRAQRSGGLEVTAPRGDHPLAVERDGQRRKRAGSSAPARPDGCSPRPAYRSPRGDRGETRSTPHCSHSSTEAPSLRKASTACLSFGAAAARPSTAKRARPSSRTSDAPGVAGRGRRQRGTDTSLRLPPSAARCPRREPLPRRRGTSPARARRRATRAAWPPSRAAMARRSPCRPTRSSRGGSSTRARESSSGASDSAAASKPRATSNPPAWMFTCAAASIRSTRRPGSAVRLAERSRNAAAAASPRALGPTRGLLQFGRDCLVGTGCRLGAMPRSAIRIDLRIDRRRERAACAALGRRSRLVHRRSDEGMTEAHPRGDVEQVLIGSGRRGVSSDAERLGGAPEQASRRRPGRQQPATSIAAWARAGCRARAHVPLLDVIPEVAGRGKAEATGELAALIPLGSSSRASGFPRVSAMIRSRTPSSSRPGTTVSSSARASSSGSPSSDSSGKPTSCPSSSLPSRTANTIATDSANSRRATKPRT